VGGKLGRIHRTAISPTVTQALRVEFDRASIGIDELQVFGPDAINENLALAASGATLTTDETMTVRRNDLSKAHDGLFGTMAWRAKAAKDSKEMPWVEIHFPEPEKVSRFRFSSNRQYYFETDYLVQKNKGNFPGYRISSPQADGSWRQIGDTRRAREILKQKPALKKAADRLQQLIAELAEEGPRYSFVGQFIEPKVTHILKRGSPENPGDEVPPAALSAMNGDLGLDSNSPDPLRRRRFAEWLTRPDHPLTARVMANRIWQHVFGKGIVSTGSDFGAAGSPPTHPELLDWLAAEFREPTQSRAAPWSMKALIRLLVMSDAFRRSSRPTEEGMQSDPGDNLLWRYAPQRVEAEVIRDAVLEASGKLDLTVGGRSFRIFNVKKTYAQWLVVDNHGPKTWRRMIYQERMRRVDDRIFTAFDFPDCGQVAAKRPVSTTPLQALNLMNSDFVVEQSNYLAERARKEAGPETKAAVGRAFELLLERPPAPDELAACVKVADSEGLPIVCRSLINSNEFAFLP